MSKDMGAAGKTTEVVVTSDEIATRFRSVMAAWGISELRALALSRQLHLPHPVRPYPAGLAVRFEERSARDGCAVAAVEEYPD